MDKRLIPADYRDYIYRLTYYALSGVAPHIPKRISPNHISILAFIFAMIGTSLLFFVKTPAAYLYWVIFNFIWFLLDALDGMHARLTNQSSEYGAFLDHALDNIYFVFMLTAIAYKFNLTQILYIYIIILRVTASLMVFTVQAHTKRFYLGRFTGGLEFLLMTAAMLLTYFYPHANPLQWTTNSTLLSMINDLDLQQGVFMKLAFLPYFFGIPINIILQFRFVKMCLSAN